MQIAPGTYCPLIKGECLQNKCAWFVKLIGTNPQTGAQVDEWNCAVQWLPMLLIENAQQARSTGAAVESFRNEMSKQNGALGQALLANMGHDANEL